MRMLFGRLWLTVACALVLMRSAAAQGLCTNAGSCNGRSTVAPTYNASTGTCECSCRNSWTGTQCQNCLAQYDATDDCAACATGYTDYPACTSVACTLADCSNHAIAVTGFLSTGCTCTCRNEWTGSACATCPPQFDSTQDCGTCAAGFSGYPDCYRSCTIAQDCSGHAVAVSGNTNTGCTCSCRNSWSGSSCNTCPPTINAALDCSVCNAGFSGYPNCARLCTNQLDCSGHATAVSGVYGNCACTCSNSWSGSSCSICPSNFNTGTDCAACAAGYDTYPLCIQTTTSTTPIKPLSSSAQPMALVTWSLVVSSCVIVLVVVLFVALWCYKRSTWCNKAAADQRCAQSEQFVKFVTMDMLDEVVFP